jgi:hypothetical protein
MIKLPFDLLYDYISESKDFEFEGVGYTFKEKRAVDQTKVGKNWTAIYSNGAGKFFAIEVFLIQYGYEDFSLEEDYNDCQMYPVRQIKTITFDYVRA